MYIYLEKISFNRLCLFAISLSIFFVTSTNLYAQRYDHLTDKEADLIREAQAIDLRMKVFVRAINRRFLVLDKKVLTKQESKKLQKEAEKWGELPDDSRTKLLTDIEKILDEAINNIDDAAERDSKSDLFPSAVHILADASKNYIPKLKGFYESAKTDREKAVTYQAIEYCTMIIEASTKIKKPEKKKKKRKKS